MWPLSPGAYCPRDRRDAADRLARPVTDLRRSAGRPSTPHSSFSLPATRYAGSRSRSTPETGNEFSRYGDPRASQLAAIERAFAEAGVLVLGAGDVRDGGQGVRFVRR